MNTQNLLFENSEHIPEYLYIRLMNTIKLDFHEKEKERSFDGSMFILFLTGISVFLTVLIIFLTIVHMLYVTKFVCYI